MSCLWMETAERYAVILNGLWMIGRPIPTNDLWIAASAMQHGLTILRRMLTLRISLKCLCTTWTSLSFSPELS